MRSPRSPTWTSFPALRGRLHAEGGRAATAVAALAFFSGLASACGPADPERPAAPEAVQVAWHPGGVASAFARARREEKPLLLYWGAAWCPPCQYLEHTVFRRPEFVERSRRFVNLYLDGDSAGAQRLGEELGVHGYPTVVLFDSRGQEITRIPSLPIERFVRVLDESLARLRPIGMVLGEALAAESGSADPADLHALAFYAWEEDPELLPSGEARVSAFRRLHERTPPSLPVERSRFLLAWLRGLVRLPTGAGAPGLTAAETAAISDELEGVLDDPRLVRANLAALADSASRIVGLLRPERSPERDRLVDAWIAAMRGAADDPSLPHEDRLDALFPVLELHRLRHVAAPGEGPLPDAVLAYVGERIRSAVDETDDRVVRHSVWNRINALSRRAGLARQAESLVAATLDETVAPFYYMWLLADHAKRSGRPEEAIEWRRRAYEASGGGATRFEAGRYYLETLIELAPEGSGRIEEETERVLDELLGREDAFANRNREGLERLDGVLRAWGEAGERARAVGRIRERVREACPGFPGEGPTSPRARCREFLAGRGGPPEAQGSGAGTPDERGAGPPEADLLYR